MEEILCFIRVGHGARDEQRGEERGYAEFAGKKVGSGGIGGIPRLPAR
jgi:hypothetical protein